MDIEILGTHDRNSLYCAGSFTKLLTTYVTLSHIAEIADLNHCLDDENFFTRIACTVEAKRFLALFQKIIGSHFTLRDVCSFYTGLPYTFGLGTNELDRVEQGLPFKHHSITDEAVFLGMCRDHITTIYPNRSKFHYSEIAIIFLGYFMEKAFNTSIEKHFDDYVINKFSLSASHFSRRRPASVLTQDLSARYDYPSIAILDHGFFCYSNGFYTTLNDMQRCLEQLLKDDIFQYMVDIQHARAASPRILNGLTVEMRLVGDDIIYGYEGLSFSGCNIWNYSTKQQKGYLTFTNDEEAAYPLIYKPLGYEVFDKVPNHTQTIYQHFLSQNREKEVIKAIPIKFRGNYKRVKINDSDLTDIFVVGMNDITIRNPDEVTYPTMFVRGHYHIRGKDDLPSTTVGLYEAPSGNRYMLFDGTLYQKM